MLAWIFINVNVARVCLLDRFVFLVGNLSVTKVVTKVKKYTRSNISSVPQEIYGQIKSWKSDI